MLLELFRAGRQDPLTQGPNHTGQGKPMVSREVSLDAFSFVSLLSAACVNLMDALGSLGLGWGAGQQS